MISSFSPFTKYLRFYIKGTGFLPSPPLFFIILICSFKTVNYIAIFRKSKELKAFTAFINDISYFMIFCKNSLSGINKIYTDNTVLFLNLIISYIINNSQQLLHHSFLNLIQLKSYLYFLQTALRSNHH